MPLHSRHLHRCKAGGVQRVACSATRFAERPDPVACEVQVPSLAVLPFFLDDLLHRAMPKARHLCALLLFVDLVVANRLHRVRVAAGHGREDGLQVVRLFQCGPHMLKCFLPGWIPLHGLEEVLALQRAKLAKDEAEGRPGGRELGVPQQRLRTQGAAGRDLSAQLYRRAHVQEGPRALGARMPQAGWGLPVLLVALEQLQAASVDEGHRRYEVALLADDVVRPEELELQQRAEVPHKGVSEGLLEEGKSADVAVVGVVCNLIPESGGKRLDRINVLQGLHLLLRMLQVGQDLVLHPHGHPLLLHEDADRLHLQLQRAALVVVAHDHLRQHAHDRGANYGLDEAKQHEEVPAVRGPEDDVRRLQQLQRAEREVEGGVVPPRGLHVQGVHAVELPADHRGRVRAVHFLQDRGVLVPVRHGAEAAGQPVRDEEQRHEEAEEAHREHDDHVGHQMQPNELLQEALDARQPQEPRQAHNLHNPGKAHHRRALEGAGRQDHVKGEGGQKV
mmetsp:Transcript_103232/g.301106  ORF Transcript_103232/g.301106 Transcript_103232/m.301106 type:complete len:505 (-) Transcript_103232:658-2172(-)